MKRSLTICALALLILPAVALASEEDSIAAEIEQAIATSNVSGDWGALSKHGSREFWSNGGPLLEIDPSSPPTEFDELELEISDLEVMPLRGGVVVAMYTTKGTLKPKDLPAVPNYHVRVTAVFVKEDGQWKYRARHFSPAAGGAGTSEPVE